MTNELTKAEIEVIKNPSEKLKDVANFDKILNLFEKMQGEFNIDLVTLNLDFSIMKKLLAIVVLGLLYQVAV